MKLSEAIERFIASLRYEREMAENTCLAYQNDLSFFRQWAESTAAKSYDTLKREDIVAYLKTVRDAGASSATLARRLVAVRQFYRFLKERHFIATDPTELLDGQKKGRTLPRILTEEEVFRLLDSISGEAPRDLRDRALLETLYGCGLRVSEACDLKREDIVADGELVRVFGKGSKERLVPLGHAAGAAIGRYLEKARGRFLSANSRCENLFVTRLGKAFTRQGIFKILRQRAAAVGIAAEAISPHVLRHCFASHMLQRGADIRAIQELLGHADIGTTQIYTHINEGSFREIHHRFHPRA